MKIFVDTANLNDIEDALKRGFVRGVTTNPSLFAKEPKADFGAYVQKIVKLIQEYQSDAHLSVEVFSQDSKQILEQAKYFKKMFALKNLSIKVPIGWDELEIIKQLRAEDISVNCTCNMSVSQAVMAAAAGAKYVSLFWARIRDAGEKSDDFHKSNREKILKEKVAEEQDFDPFVVVQETRALIADDYPNTEIIAGSMRSVQDVMDAGRAGAHIVTVPPKFFPGMIRHFKTDEKDCLGRQWRIYEIYYFSGY